jgi:uncharacterized protein YutE (UPF0331/DUF86 family)
LSVLREFQSIGYDEFAANYLFSSAAERHFQVAIQAAIDIGQYLLSNLMIKQPADYADTFVKLGEAGVVPPDFASRLVDMARFRNVLVRLYLEVDARKVYQYIQNNLGDFEIFARYVADFVQNYPKTHGFEKIVS